MTRETHMHVKLATLGAVAACALALNAGCASSQSIAPKTTEGVWGFVATAQTASVALDNQRTSMGSIVVKRVVAPADCFLVVTSSDAGAVAPMLVGLARLKSGESTDVVISIMGLDSPSVEVTLYLDRGQKGRFESDPMNPASSPDRPVFVDGRPVSVVTQVTRPETPLGAGGAVLDVFDQPGRARLDITHVVTPGPSWLVVSSDVNGAPGQLLAQMSLTATDAIGIALAYQRPAGSDSVFVSLHKDDGVLGSFEYRSATASSTPDQPYLIGGTPAVKRVGLQ